MVTGACAGAGPLSPPSSNWFELVLFAVVLQWFAVVRSCSTTRKWTVARVQDHGRVLVVEDDESAAVFVTRVLDRAGFESSWAVDADEATVLLSSSHYDVLLTDFRLPGRSGLELVRETRGSQPAIGIAMMTSFNETGLEGRARSFGADDFFEKPLVPSSLVSRVEHLAGRSRRGEARTEQADESSGCEEAAERRGSGHGDDAAPAASAPAAPGAPPASGTPAAHADPASPGTRAAASLDPAGEPKFVEVVDVTTRTPVFRRIGGTPRVIGAVPLWASAMPTVSRVASAAGPVTSPRTSAAWSFAD
jgi:CheY-like chemotaxis protein